MSGLLRFRPENNTPIASGRSLWYLSGVPEVAVMIARDPLERLLELASPQRCSKPVHSETSDFIARKHFQARDL